MTSNPSDDDESSTLSKLDDYFKQVYVVINITIITAAGSRRRCLVELIEITRSPIGTATSLLLTRESAACDIHHSNFRKANRLLGIYLFSDKKDRVDRGLIRFSL